LFAIFLASFVSCIAITRESLAQETYNSRIDFHQKTGYGTLAFDRGALDSKGIDNIKDFVIVHDGTNHFPQQGAYCFVLNHYSSPNPPQVYTYTFTTTWRLSDQKSIDPIHFAQQYTPTTDPSASQFPSYCIRDLSGAVQTDVQTDSTEGPEFTHTFSFQVN
jgi:hypothetical protein